MRSDTVIVRPFVCFRRKGREIQCRKARVDWAKRKTEGLHAGVSCFIPLETEAMFVVVSRFHSKYTEMPPFKSVFCGILHSYNVAEQCWQYQIFLAFQRWRVWCCDRRHSRSASKEWYAFKHFVKLCVVSAWNWQLWIWHNRFVTVWCIHVCWKHDSDMSNCSQIHTAMSAWIRTWPT